MAFDMPLEADQPSELGFFSAFITAPISGTVMWILGGGKEGESKEETETEDLLATMPQDGTTLVARKEATKQSGTYLSNAASRSIPDASESDVSSSDGECSYSADNWGISTEQTGDDENASSLRHRKKDCSRRMRRTSWSDESGQSLVEYLNETTLHEPPSDSQPVKSVMKKSRSTYSKNMPIAGEHDLDAMNKHVSSQQQYIPSGITGTGGGIVMPTGGGAKPSGVSNGYVSPQWGWYISTTPPTPEYPTKKSISSARKIKYSSKDTNISFEPQKASATEDLSKHMPCEPAPVFTKGVKGVGRTHMEWSGIPL